MTTCPCPAADPAQHNGPESGHSIGYIAGLDGIRALGVLAVIGFHADLSWASGGFLGVSLFFTLSGFLITTLLLDEHERTGGIDLPGFFVRRLRRLLPAAALTVLVVIAVSWQWPLTSAPSLQRDALSALLDVSNWRFALTGRSYSDLFVAPSPLLHFWSLSAEEQFYLVLPVAATLALRRSRRSFAIALSVMAIGSLTCTLVMAAADRADLVYYSTPSRAFELLAGAALAIVWRSRSRVITAPVSIPGSLSTVVGTAGLGALAALMVLTDRSDRWLMWGGLSAVSIASVCVIVGVLGSTPLQRVFEAAPLRWIGQVSYGLYLIHWPVFTLLSAQRLGLDRYPALGVQLALTASLAAVSALLVERPIRFSRALTRRSVLVGAPAITVMAIVAVSLVPLTSPASATSFENVRDELFAGDGTANSLTPPSSSTTIAESGPPAAGSAPAAASTTIAPTATGPTATGPTAAVPAPQVKIATFGDSTSLLVSWGLAVWGLDTKRLEMSGGDAKLGCGIGRGGDHRYGRSIGKVPEECNSWATVWPEKLAASGASIAVVLDGPWDAADRRLPGDKVWRAAGDPVYDEFLASEFAQAADVLHDAGATTVVWLTSPHNILEKDTHPDADYPVNDPARIDRINELIRTMAATRPYVRVVEFGAMLAALPGGEFDPALRPDGTHLTKESAEQVAIWLAPLVLDAAANTTATSNPAP